MIIFMLWIGLSLRSKLAKSFRKAKLLGRFLSWLPLKSSWIKADYFRHVLLSLEVGEDGAQIIQSSVTQVDFAHCGFGHI